MKISHRIKVPNSRKIPVLTVGDALDIPVVNTVEFKLEIFQAEDHREAFYQCQDCSGGLCPSFRMDTGTIPDEVLHYLKTHVVLSH